MPFIRSSDTLAYRYHAEAETSDTSIGFIVNADARSSRQFTND